MSSLFCDDMLCISQLLLLINFIYFIYIIIIIIIIIIYYNVIGPGKTAPSFNYWFY